MKQSLVSRTLQGIWSCDYATAFYTLLPIALLVAFRVCPALRGFICLGKNMQSMSVLLRMALMGHRYFCVQRSRLSLVFLVVTRDPVSGDYSCSSASLTLVCPLLLAIPADVQCCHVGGLFFSLLLWERAHATMLGRGQRTAWQSCPLLPPLRSFWGSNLGHQVCTASESEV